MHAYWCLWWLGLPFLFICDLISEIVMRYRTGFVKPCMWGHCLNWDINSIQVSFVRKPLDGLEGKCKFCSQERALMAEASLSRASCTLSSWATISLSPTWKNIIKQQKLKKISKQSLLSHYPLVCNLGVFSYKASWMKMGSGKRIFHFFHNTLRL